MLGRGGGGCLSWRWGGHRSSSDNRLRPAWSPAWCNVLGLNDELAEVDARTEETLQQHRLATIITSMPGVGHLLTAELLAGTNGDLTNIG